MVAAGKLRNALMLIPGIVILLSLASMHSGRILKGHNDFLQLYCGSRLVGTADLYSVEANKRVQREAIGLELEGVYFSRPPFYAFLLSPLGWLSYPYAYAVFQIVSLLSVAAFLRLYLPQLSELALYCSLSVPLLASFATGQDLGLVLLLAGLSMLLVKEDREFLAGLMLALCAIKFHLFLLMPLVLLIHRRWRVLMGGAAGGTALVLTSFVAGGPYWFQAYAILLRNPALHPGSEHMPNLHGLLSVLSISSLPAEAWLSLVVTAMVAFIAWKTPDVELALAFALVGGLLISFHAYVQDCVILLLVFVVICSKPVSRAERAIAALAVLPPVYLLLLLGKPYSLAAPVMFFALLFAGFVRSWKGARPALSYEPRC